MGNNLRHEHREKLMDFLYTIYSIILQTMSNAPVWSRDVSRLLNAEAEHDWRLLAKRLGYSVENIRGWASQADPCMALLSEWYATNKTSEATHAVLQTLKDMGRQDAVEVIERAKLAAGEAFNPSNAEATFALSTRMQKSLKT